MANEPKVRSYQQILGDTIDGFLARSGVDDLRPGSVLLSIFESTAQSDFRNSQDIFAVLKSRSLDRAEDGDLEKLANDENVFKFTQLPATGKVTLLDGSFTKISTKVYPGTAAPNIGSTTIFVVDATSFPSTGSIYIGRGTPNVEGPISYTAATQIGTFWSITLASGTSKFHNLSESVILAQGGNRSVSSGTVVQTPQGDVASAVEFTTTTTTTIPDGEDSLINVPVIASSPGTLGNVPRNAVSDVPNAIFPNIGVINPLPFVTGRDEESNAELRERVRDAIQSRALGTSLAIENAVIGIRASDEPKIIISAKVVEQTGLPTTLFIDDGTGYEELFTGVGLANVVDQALGGEKFLQLQHRAIAKAQLVTSIEAPFLLSGGETLAIMVGGVRSEHSFIASDFISPGAATGFEITASINGNPNALFSASTIEDGTKVRVFSKADVDEDLLILSPSSGTDANAVLQLNENTTYTLNLYKNDILLFKDGVIPQVVSEQQSTWGATIVSGETLILNVDNTGPITYTVIDADFVTADTGFSTVSPNNSLTAWVAVLNAKLAGITASVSGSQIILQSNRGATATSSVLIDPTSTLVVKTMFSSTQGLSQQGSASDYEFNRNTGQINLADVLVENDIITAGSEFTRGYIQSAAITSGIVNLTADANLWFIIDGAATAVNIEIATGSTLVVSDEGDNVWRYKITGNAAAFTSIAVGDWFVSWDPGITDSNNQGFWRIVETGVDAGDAYLEIEKSTGTGASYTLSSIGGAVGLAVARSTEPMQQITIASGLSKTLATVVSEINAQIIGALASVRSGNIVRVTPLTFDLDGGSMIVSADLQGKNLLFVEGTTATNRASHTAFVETTKSELSTPLFTHDALATGDATEPPASIVSMTDLVPLGSDPNSLLGFLKPLGATDRYSSNRNNHTQQSNITGTAISLVSKDTIHEVIVGTLDDRIFPAVPFDINGEDTLVAVIDQDAVNKTFSIPLSRNILVNATVAPTTTTFNVYDTDRGPTETLDTTFGSAFDFNNFKLWMKARTVLNPSGSLNALLYRFADYGADGENARIGYFYPTQPSLAISSSVLTGKFSSIRISLPSDTARTLSHSALTEYDVTTAGAGPFTVTYTHNATGPSPSFIANGVVIGDIVTISDAVGTGFNTNNLGTFRVTARTATSITVTRPSLGTAEAGIALATTSNLQVYPLGATNTAQDIKDYVDANLSNYIETVATDEDPIATPNDLTGTIDLSTLDDKGYRSEAIVAGTGATRAGNIVTITTSVAHGLLIGDVIVLAGGTLAAGTLSFEGTFAIETVPGVTSFTFTQIGPDEDEGGGTVEDTGYARLLDGENWISSTSLGASPQLTLKKPLLFSDTLYSLIGESMKLIPTTADQTSRYMNVLGVTGITSVAGVTTAQHGDKLQIHSNTLGSVGAVQVTGGTGNSTAGSVLGSASIVDSILTRMRIGTPQKQGFHAGQFIRITATAEQPKTLGFDTTTSITVLSGAPNTITIAAGSGSFETAKVDSSDGATVYQVERQGDFFVIVHDSGTAPAWASAGVEEGDWAVIGAGSGFASANIGTFRVVRRSGDSIYIENANGVEETTGAGANVDFFSYDSVRPGDTLNISGTILGADNVGGFVVASIISATVIEVNGTMSSIGPIVLGTDFGQVQIIEENPFQAIKRIHTLAINPSDTDQLDVVVEGIALFSKINATSGAGMQALNKYGFSTNLQLGIDGYKRHLGLILEANKVVYGDPTNPSTFKGVKAAGAQLNLNGPLQKRIQVSLSVRILTGVPFNEVEEEIKSGVSAVINNTPVGKPVVISDIITAAGAVDGVQAVSIVSPTFNSDNDLIAVQTFEKPLVIDPDTDITVSQVGS